MKYIYLIVNLVDAEVKGTNDAEDASVFIDNDDYLIICTTGNTQSFSADGEMVDVGPLGDDDEENENDDDSDD